MGIVFSLFQILVLLTTLLNNQVLPLARTMSRRSNAGKANGEISDAMATSPSKSKESAQDKQVRLLAEDVGHFSMIRYASLYSTPALTRTDAVPRTERSISQ